MFCQIKCFYSSNLFIFLVFYFSGEKTSAKDWPGSLEIKGRVRLDAFEKFLQELPQSRSRAVMVSKSSFLLFDSTCILLCLCYGVPLNFSHAVWALPLGNMYLLFDLVNIRLKKKEVDLKFILLIFHLDLV